MKVDHVAHCLWTSSLERQVLLAVVCLCLQLLSSMSMWLGNTAAFLFRNARLNRVLGKSPLIASGILLMHSLCPCDLASALKRRPCVALLHGVAHLTKLLQNLLGTLLLQMVQLTEAGGMHGGIVAQIDWLTD